MREYRDHRAVFQNLHTAVRKGWRFFISGAVLRLLFCFQKGKTMTFDYFYGSQSESFSFYRTPRLLITDATFKKLSFGAKLLYGLLLGRMGLSARSGWYDEQSCVFTIPWQRSNRTWAVVTTRRPSSCGNWIKQAPGHRLSYRR